MELEFLIVVFSLQVGRQSGHGPGKGPARVEQVDGVQGVVTTNPVGQIDGLFQAQERQSARGVSANHSQHVERVSSRKMNQSIGW